MSANISLLMRDNTPGDEIQQYAVRRLYFELLGISE